MSRRYPPSMTVAAAVLSILIALVALGSAIGTFLKVPRVVENITGVGITDAQLPLLAGLKLLGAIGVLVGFAVPAIGVAAAIGLTLYFLGAVAFHVRAGDGPDAFGPPLGLAVLAAAAAITRALTM